LLPLKQILTISVISTFDNSTLIHLPPGSRALLNAPYGVFQNDTLWGNDSNLVFTVSPIEANSNYSYWTILELSNENLDIPLLTRGISFNPEDPGIEISSVYPPDANFNIFSVNDYEIGVTNGNLINLSKGLYMWFKRKSKAL